MPIHKKSSRTAVCCLTALTAVLAAGCNKQPEARTGQCRIIAMKDSVIGRPGVNSWTYRYDQNGRLIESLGSDGLTTFTYQGQWMYVEQSDGRRDTTLLRPDGGPLLFRSWNQGSLVRTTRYEYDAFGRLKSMYSSGLRAGTREYDTAYFEWEEGNIVGHTYRSIGSWTDYYTYYPDKESQPAEDWSWDQYRALGFVTLRSRNLRKSTGSFNYRYVFDDKGRIVADTVYASGPVQIRYFQYDCP